MIHEDIGIGVGTKLKCDIKEKGNITKLPSKLWAKGPPQCERGQTSL